MEDMTLALAVLLGVGFAAAKLGQLVRLPSVTGYICAGLLLGPTGVNLVTPEAVGRGLGHFNQIALMLIAFGIGEHLELKRLRSTAKSVCFISIAEITGAMAFVGAGIFVVSQSIHVGSVTWGTVDYALVAMLLATVSVATAPATTLHVLRESRAIGPMTSILLPVVAVNNGLAIILFGIAISVAHHFTGSGPDTIVAAVGASSFEVIGSLLLGAATGLLIDTVVNRLRRRSEMLTFGLALLLLCGEGARVFFLSPLLAGMAAGFVIVNRDHRDVRLFRTLNAFEPPVYVLFFTLAGAQLDLDALAIAGWVGLVYFLLRAGGKIIGASIGARLIKAPVAVRRYLGLALVPQAGVAIGLILLIQGIDGLGMYSSVITPVVLAGVFLSELAGPACTRMALERAGEAMVEPSRMVFDDVRVKAGAQPHSDPVGPRLVPWSWGQLDKPVEPDGVVMFGASHAATVGGLARIATLFAHHHRARPLSVRVMKPGDALSLPTSREEMRQLFEVEEAEVRCLGYDLDTIVVHADSVATGLLEVASQGKCRGIVLGYPFQGTVQEFERVVEAVAREAPCPVIVVRFAGILHTERILVPLASRSDLEIIRSALRSLTAVGGHRVTLLRLLPSDAREEELVEARTMLMEWADHERMTPLARCQSIATEARQQTIAEEALHHDLLLMAAPARHGLQRFFFGSLAEEVAHDCASPLIMVYAPRGDAPPSHR